MGYLFLCLALLNVKQGAALILSFGMPAIFFKEKVTPKAIIGIPWPLWGCLL